MNPKQKLEKKRAKLLKDAEALRAADGTFATDQVRADFDAKMTAIEAIDAEIRALEDADDVDEPVQRGAKAPTPAEIAKTERARVTTIQDLVRTHGLDEGFGKKLVDDGVAIEAARAQILDQLTERSTKNPTHPHIEIGADATDKAVRGMTNWLLVKGGAAENMARAAKVERPGAAPIEPVGDAGEFRGMTLVDLARHCLSLSGRSTRGMDKMALVSLALTARGTISQSTSDFATVLENVMHKMLLAAYAITPDTWSRFCATGTVSDFRASNRYRMGSFGTLDSLTENGEFKNKAITDAEKQTITAATKGNIINVSRKMIVNDDMGAFASLLSNLGRAAKLSVEVDVYALLTSGAGNNGPTLSDGYQLFDNTHHYNVPTGAALSAANIDLDRVAMAQQMDKDRNEYLDLRPAILLVAVGLGGQAKVINQSQYDPDTVANKSQMKPNIVVGLFRDVVDTPRLSGNTRYLFADPSIAPVIEVAYLEGQDTPVLEAQDGWRTDGAEMKVRYDYAVGAIDFRGVIRNAGQ
jgi:hypothetical protein